MWLLEVLKLPNFYLFASMVSIPVLLLVNGKNKLSINRGFMILLIGTSLLSIASFIEVLDELPIGNFLKDMTFNGITADKSRMLLFFVPSIFIVGLGLSYWLPDIKQLSKEIERRTQAENEMLILLKEMQELARREEEANQAKGDFLATMSHELRTPLNAVIGFADALRIPEMKKSEEERDEYLKIIAESGNHLLSLINDILDLSKVEQGKLNLSYSKFNVRNEILNNIEILNLTAKNKNIKIKTVLNDVNIETDQRLFKQIIINILSNAIKFSPENTVITIKAEEIDVRVCISIEDEGIGMSETELASVLEPFVQVENTYTRSIEGSGLGLALVSRFLILLGGEMKISSVKGQGTTVKAYISNSKMLTT